MAINLLLVDAIASKRSAGVLSHMLAEIYGFNYLIIHEKLFICPMLGKFHKIGPHSWKETR
jgi:hypothetical protein